MFEITELIKYCTYKILDRLELATPFENVRNELIDKVFCTNELISVSRTDNLKEYVNGPLFIDSLYPFLTRTSK